MHSINIAFNDYPSWYKVEKETEYTIKKLTTLKELMPYLRNSDEFIRRLAILRINELRLKDSIIALKELLDDSLETTKNKEFAAWTIRAISLHWNTELFITNKYLNKYSGKERYTDICKICIKDSLPSLKFNFTTSIVNSELQIENNDITNSKDMNFDLPFSVKEWFSQYSKEILQDLKLLLIKLPFLLFKFLKSAIIFSFSALYGLIKVFINLVLKIKVKYKENHANKKIEPASQEQNTFEVNNYSFKGRYSEDNEIQMLRKSYDKSSYDTESYLDKPSHKKNIKNVVFNIFYVILSPVRFARNNKKIFVVILILVYCFLTFSTQGKVIMYRYTGLDLMEEQTKAFNTTKEILSYALAEAEDLIGMSHTKAAQKEVIPIDGPVVIEENQQLQFKVLAKKGLNLRQEPVSSSAKITLLPFDAIVTYTGESKDTSSGTWYKLVTIDGETGWASSNFLEKIGGLQNE